MKDHTSSYIALEEGQKRKPIELYKFWREGGEYWYYTSHDTSITYDSNTYTPATINRGTAKYDSQFEVSRMNIQVTYIEDPAVEFISQNPVELIWVEIRRYFADLPTETSVIFVGQIKNVTFQGNSGSIVCVGFEHVLRTRVPRYRWQLGCNNDLYDYRCGVYPDYYDLTTSVDSVSADGTEITSVNFGAVDDGYWTRGYLVWGDFKRMIVDHSNTTIKIRYKMAGFTSGETVTVYAGCDKQLSTCINKFMNGDRFFGHPYIPLDNPALWTP